MKAVNTRVGNRNAMNSFTSCTKCNNTMRPLSIILELSRNVSSAGSPSQTSARAVAASNSVIISGPRILVATVTVHPRCDNLSRKRVTRSFGISLRISGARAMAAVSSSCLVAPIVCFRRLTHELMLCLVWPNV